MKPNSFFRYFLSISSSALLCISSSHAADVTWDVTPGTVGVGNGSLTGGSGVWNTSSGNWTTNGGVNNRAWVNANNDTAIFGGTVGTGTVTLGTGVTAGRLVFSTPNYSITGGTLTLGTAGNITANVNANIRSVLAGSAITKTGSGTLTLFGNNSYTGTMTVSSGTLSIGDGITNGTLGSSYRVNSPGALRVRYNGGGVPASWTGTTWNNFTGTGTLALATGKSGDGWGDAALRSDFTGTLQIQGGRVATSPVAGGGFGGAKAIRVLAGGQLSDWRGSAITQNLTIAGTGYGEGGLECAIRMSGGATPSVLSGLVSLSASATIGANSTGILTNVISGTAGSTLTVGTWYCNGKVILAADNTYAGATNIAAGTLQIGNGGATGALGAGAVTNNGTLVFNRSGALNLVQAITGSGAVSQEGSGTVTLTGANNYLGATTVSAGTLAIGDGITNGTLGSLYRINSPGTLRIRYNTNGVQAAWTDTIWNNFTGNGTLALATGKSGDGWGNAALTSNFTGTLQIEGGRVGTNAVTGSGFGNATAINILAGGQLMDWRGSTITQNLTIAGTGYGEGGLECAIRMSADATPTILSGLVNLSANATIAANSTGILTNVISGAAGSTLTVGTWYCNGNVILAGANNYLGATTINAGTLTLGRNGALPAGSAVSIGDATLNAGRYSNSAGTLEVKLGSSTPAKIVFGSGGTLAFTNSTALLWMDFLQLGGNFVSGASIRVGTTSGGLTPSQLQRIIAPGFSGFALNAQGYVTATAQTAPNFGSWQMANNTSQSFSQDLDGDGVTNGIEYFLHGTGDSSGADVFSSVTSSAGNLSVTWTKAATYPGIYGTNFVVQTSSTSASGPWINQTVGSRLVLNGDSITYNFPAGAQTFVRLVVSETAMMSKSAEQLAAFYEANGGKAGFSHFKQKALETVLYALDEIESGQLVAARARIDAMLAIYPFSSPGAGWYDDLSFRGLNLGIPVGYNALKMLDQILTLGNPTGAGKLQMTAVVVTTAAVTRPTLPAYVPETVQLGIAPEILADDAYRLHLLTRLFRRWVQAITGGLELELKVHTMDESTIVGYRTIPNNNPAGPDVVISEIDQEQIINSMPSSIANTTDLWWVIVPSGVPTNASSYDRDFVTGGMSRHSSGVPVLLADDASFIRKTGGLSTGLYSEVELMMYQPAWLQHEFMHHVYSVWPQFQLEVVGHQFNYPELWPSDFQGYNEPDYYIESIKRRLLGATPSLAQGLSALEYADMTVYPVAKLVGNYQRLPRENSWHDMTMSLTNGNLKWTNSAGVNWDVNIIGMDPITVPTNSYAALKLRVQIDQNDNVVSISFKGDKFMRIPTTANGVMTNLRRSSINASPSPFLLPRLSPEGAAKYKAMDPHRCMSCY